MDNILIVDDTPDNLRLLMGILTERGYRVRPTPTGARALSAIQAEPPDLILLDIKMPGMSGYEVCERLKADERTRDIPVIFLSALNELIDKVKGFELGGVDYILHILKKANWKINGDDGAASLLGLHPSTLRSRMQKLGIQRP